jgi:PAS domain-containing protein
MLLRNHTPACVIVNEQGEILYVHGRSGKYLEVPPGEASLNLLRTAREGLKLELASALRKVVAQRQPVRFTELQVRINGGFQAVDVTVEPADGNILLVTFEDSPPKPAPATQPGGQARPGADPASAAEGSPDGKDHYIAQLEREVHVKSERLQTTIEELETSNEELKSTNEELQSTNEELQSTNEELETSKEELQSVNEELVTVNTELQQKMEGLSRANNDMNNLLAGTGIGMLFVDHQLHIQRFTPATTRIINLIQSDIGRPVSDLVFNLAGYNRLGEDVKAVLDSLIPRESEVQTRDGHWYLMRILPYRTVDNVIEGAVLTFVDIAAQKRAEEQFRKLSAELEQRVQERVLELGQVKEVLERQTRLCQELEARRNAEIAALARLSEVPEQVSQEDSKRKLLQLSVDTAVQLTRAEMAMVHLYDPATQTLRLAAQRGFKESHTAHFSSIGLESRDTSGEALRTRARVVVENINQSPIFETSPMLPILEAAGVGAVQSTPVVSRKGDLLAVISTCWQKRCQPDESILRLLDMASRQLADLLEIVFPSSALKQRVGDAKGSVLSICLKLSSVTASHGSAASGSL